MVRKLYLIKRGMRRYQPWCGVMAGFSDRSAHFWCGCQVWMTIDGERLIYRYCGTHRKTLAIVRERATH